jgi:hypothetical protein
MADAVPPTPTPERIAPRPWSAPTLRELPKLTRLTLASLIGGGGGTGGGGSTVFGLLLALVGLTGCFADRGVTPGDGVTLKPIASVPCNVEVATRTVSCGGPAGAITPEILGGQGVRVVLRSSNVSYALDTFRFDVSVQNLSTQAIGTNGATTTGVRVFFQQPPVTTNGPGLIDVEEDSIGDFTATGQSYYVYTDSIATKGISPTQTWKFSLPATVLNFSFTVLVAAEVGDYGGILRWSEVDSLGHTRLYGVGAHGPNDAMIVGRRGHSLYWNGVTWERNPSVTNDTLTSTQPLGPGSYVATGEQGRIYLFDDGIWTLIHQRGDNLPLTHIWVRDATHFVAAGPDGAVTWYVAGVFTDEHAATGEGIYTVTGSQAGIGVTFLTDLGNAWYNTGPGDGWIGPDLLDPFNWVLDIDYDADGARILSLWDPVLGNALVDHSTHGLIYAGGNQLVTKLFPFARDSVVIEVADNNSGKTYLMKVTYGAAPPALPVAITGEAPFANFGARGAVMNAAKDQVIISDGTGQMWSNIGGPFEEIDAALNPTGSFAGMWGIGDTIFAVDSTTTLWKVVGNSRAQLTAPVGAKAIWGFSSTELYVVAYNQVWRGDGVGTWQLEATLTNFGGGEHLTKIWGDAGSGLLIVIGQNGRWMSRHFGAWGEWQTGGADWTAVGGCDGSNAWLATAAGPVWKWTDGAFNVDGVYNLASGGINRHIGAITAWSCDDVWFVGSDPIAFRYVSVLGTYGVINTGIQIDSVTTAVMQGAQQVAFGGAGGSAATVSDFYGNTRLTVPTHGTRISALWKLQNGTLMATDASRILRGLR